LRQLGHEVVQFANGKAVEIFKDDPSVLKHYQSAVEIVMDLDLRKLPKPDAVITSMCSKGGIGRDLSYLTVQNKLGRYFDFIPTIALQDFWGGEMVTSWANKEGYPEFIVVNDEIGADIVQKAWPGYNRANIAITGFPAMDKYATYNADEASRQAMQKLNLRTDMPIVLYGGQGNLTSHALQELVTALNELGQPVQLIPHPHPRMQNDYAHEYEPWQKALESFKAGTIIDSSTCDTSSLIAASTVTVSMYSTMLVEAAVLRKQNISILYKDFGMKELRKGTTLIDEFPLASLKCTAKATDRNQLRKFLEQSFQNNLGLRENQENNFKLDGKNAQRAAEFIVSVAQ